MDNPGRGTGFRVSVVSTAARIAPGTPREAEVAAALVEALGSPSPYTSHEAAVSLFRFHAVLGPLRPRLRATLERIDNPQARAAVERELRLLDGSP